jgi:hypothetical protein
VLVYDEISTFSSLGVPRSIVTTNGPVAVLGKPVVAPTWMVVSVEPIADESVVATALPEKDLRV